MERLSSTTIFLCSSSRHLFRRTTPPPFFNYVGETVVGITHFSTSSPDSSSSSSSSSYHSSSRRNPEDARNVRVSVWWDFENCQVPGKVNVYKVTQCITDAVRAVGIKGPIQITAFGDVLQLSRSNQEALSATGINLTHIPHGGKNSADRSLLVDLMYWVSQNPPPAHLFLISGDRDFASVLHRLRMNNYNILLASTENASAVLCSAASIMWQWTSLVRGENLSGKHFNQPPDGPYASWYGHYRVPLEDPFAVCNQTSYVQLDEGSDSNSDVKPRPVPKAVLNVIRNILKLYPKGLAITELRAELGKSNVTIEKDFYGYKKFSRFLLAMPNLLRLQSEKDGQFVVHGVSPKIHDTCVPTPDTITNDSVPVVVSKEDGAHSTCGVPPGEETLPLSSKLNETKLSTDSEQLRAKQEEPLQVEAQSATVKKGKEGEVKHGHLYPVKINRPIAEVGIFKSLWRKWFRGHQEKICHTDDKTVNEVTRYAEIGQKSAENVNEDSGIFSRIVGWFKSRGSDNNTDKLNAESSKSDEEISSHSLMQEIFTESFWNELLSFFGTSKGSASILQSRTREEMVQNLQKFGPSQLEPLSEKQILQLVDLLISEKKWVAETPSQTFPFRFVGPSKSSSSSRPLDSKDSTTLLDKMYISPKNRNQILRDCQKLVNEVVKQYPNGFNISSFKKLFLEKYGYPLEVQQLGYQKLATLIQIMPGVKIESNHIFPWSAGPIPDKPPKSDNDTEWEELGPIAPMKTKKEDENDNFPMKTKKEDENDNFEAVSDNDLSDSDSETPPSGSQNQSRKGGVSTLLQVLDSWYSNQEGSNRNSNITSRIASDRSDMNTDYLNNNKNPSLSYHEAGKLKPSKSYLFVADKPEDDKENLFNGILSSLKKSENGSPQSKIEG